VTSIAQAYVEILPSARGMGTALQGEMGGVQRTLSDGTRTGFLGGFSNIAAPLAGIVASLGIGSMISDAISDASDLSETASAVETVFGDANAHVQDFAEGAASALGMTQQAALEGARQFGIFGQAAGLSGEELGTFSTDLLSLATDFASFNNVEPDQAIAAIGAGLRGESEPLRQFGILLDDAALRARALEMGIYDGNGALTQQQRVMAAQAEIFAQAGVQAGDFARTSDGLANQQRILQASVGDLSASFGSLLLPVVTQLVGFLNTSVVPALTAMSTWMQENPEKVRIIAAVVLLLAGALAVVTVAQWALNAAFLANPLTWVIVGIVALIAAIVALVVNWETVVAWVTQVWGAFVAWLISIGNSIAVWWNGLWSGIGDWFVSVWNNISSFFTTMWAGITGAFQAGVQGAVDFVVGMVDSILSTILGVGDAIYNAGRSIIQGFIDGIASMIGAVGDAIGGVMDFVAGFFPNSPAKHGPLSGSGWRAITRSGGAIEDAFASGFTGRIDDVLTSGVNVPRLPVSAEVAEYAAGRGGSPVNVTIETSQALDEYLVADVAANTLARVLR